MNYYVFNKKAKIEGRFKYSPHTFFLLYIVKRHAANITLEKIFEKNWKNEEILF